MSGKHQGQEHHNVSKDLIAMNSRILAVCLLGLLLTVGLGTVSAWAGMAPAATQAETITIPSATDTDGDGSEGNFLNIFDRLGIYTTGND